MEPAELIEGLTEERERFASYLAALPEERWEAPTLCDGWRVRDVVAHLVGNASDTVNGRLDDFGSIEFNQRQIDERASASPQAMLAEWAEIGSAMESFLTALPAEAWDTVLPLIGNTPRWGVTRLLEDLWIHAHDVRLPLGDEVTAGPGVRAALQAVADDLPKRLQAFCPTVGAVDIVAGEHKLRIEGEGEVTVTVTGDAPALAFVGTGRWDLQEQIAAGRLTVDPNPPGFATALNIYGEPLPA